MGRMFSSAQYWAASALPPDFVFENRCGAVGDRNKIKKFGIEQKISLKFILPLYRF
jgi:hypothetical protein